VYSLVGAQLQAPADVLRGGLHLLPEDTQVGGLLEDLRAWHRPARGRRAALPMDLQRARGAGAGTPAGTAAGPGTPGGAADVHGLVVGELREQPDMLCGRLHLL